MPRVATLQDGPDDIEDNDARRIDGSYRPCLTPRGRSKINMGDIMDLKEIPFKSEGESLAAKTVLTEPQFKQLAHLPLLTLFYLFFQRQFSTTPVTALELAAYLGIEVRVAEEVLQFLHHEGVVRIFKEGLAAYSLGKELDELTVKDLVVLLAKFHEVITKQGITLKPFEIKESNEKYRKIYAELASEILQLFGEASANQLPL